MGRIQEKADLRGGQTPGKADYTGQNRLWGKVDFRGSRLQGREDNRGRQTTAEGRLQWCIEKIQGKVDFSGGKNSG